MPSQTVRAINIRKGGLTAVPKVLEFSMPTADLMALDTIRIAGKEIPRTTQVSTSCTL